MYCGFGDLFEGDSKFYSNSQTFLKRAKEVQGSGVKYGFYNATKPVQPVARVVINSPLDNANFAYKTGNIVRPFRPRMTNAFRAITIHNTVKTDEHMLDILEDVLSNEKVMGKNVISKEEALNLLYGPIKKGKHKGGYQDTTINDGQSYITFEEWIRRITARGQLDKYKPLIDKILDETQPLTINDVKQFIQVQKNFYYDLYWNDETQTMSPRQIKNAEFVLVPRLIAGTQLEKVAKLMSRIGIDQLNTRETSKAGQSRLYTLWDEKGHISDEILKDIDSPKREWTSEIMTSGSRHVELFNYNFLYTQQETPQHLDTQNKAAIQFVKKIVDNIDENSPEHVKKAKARFFEVYTAKIKKSYINLLNRFKVPLDKEGNIIFDKNNNIKDVDYTQFYEALKEELTRLGLDNNMIDYCTLSENAISPTDTIMPNFISLISSKFENIVQSLFNTNITRQLLPGFHAAQITGLGFKSLAESKSDIRTDNNLQYHPQLYKDCKGNVITEREYDNLANEEKKD